MKNKILFLLFAVLTIYTANTQIPFVRLSESNNPNAIDDGLACATSATNTYNENAFYRFYDLQRYVDNGTINSGTFMLTNLEFAQSSAADDTMLTYFVGTIARSDYYALPDSPYNLIGLDVLSIIRSGNHMCKSSDNGSLINIPIDPLTLDTDQIIYYSIQAASGDLDTHFFVLGGNDFGENSSAYFNTSAADCDVVDLNSIIPSAIESIGGSFFYAIMNVYGISNPSEISQPNDTCDTAQELTVGASFDDNPVDLNTLNATQEGGGCNTGFELPVSNEIWTKVMIPAEGHLVVETGPDVVTGDTHFISGMDAWSGACGSLTYLSCGDSVFSTHNFSSIVINGTPGETVYVRIFGNFIVPFSVSAYNPPEPINITCDNGLTLTVGSVFDDEAIDETFLWTEGEPLWHTFVAPPDGNITIETGPDSNGNVSANTSIAVWSGMCGSIALVASDSNGADTFNFSKLELTGLEPGDTYFLTIADLFGAYRSPFSVSAYNTTLSTDDNTFDNFSYHPNPVNHTLTFNSLQNIDEITVSNLLGQVVLKLESKNSAPIEKVNLSSLEIGIYLFKVSIGNQFKSIRIIKNK
ncbi:T9SS type A sorting domain-containing protein [uncultured Winogradskyella sp.]|uniref:T9SS type A sorting domain-containing protein n=1 Tax=uncultured Winogradskyella sp. TaxID=395353 RepID=UPI002607BE01|nr:T9SS type A sorting domain-containing protein [uncultured Winogradskyella sp.]